MQTDWSTVVFQYVQENAIHNFYSFLKAEMIVYRKEIKIRWNIIILVTDCARMKCQIQL